jgi:formamidopyrimidine-DNA glycosylase
MNELPEVLNLAAQINKTIFGKRISGFTAAHTPHKLAWYYGEPSQFSNLLEGKTIGKATAYGGLVEIKAGNANILLGEGGNIRFHDKNEPRPAKHQLLIEFEDKSALSDSVRMYGGMGAFPEGKLENKYYKAAKEKPSPFSLLFDEKYFDLMASADEVQKLSLKALLATEQRIPGLGNGVLQDILFNAGMHPKKKVSTLSVRDKKVLYDQLKATLAAMLSGGGRDVELDLFGRPGNYKSILSKNSVNKPCHVCGTAIKKKLTWAAASIIVPNARQCKFFHHRKRIKLKVQLVSHY